MTPQVFEPHAIGEDEQKQGHFRIGHIVLQVPPSDIVTSKAANNEELIPLRSKNPMYRKTGHSRQDVTVSWKAIAYQLPDETYDWSQWEDLRTILAIFRAAPFVEVENPHLRQLLMNDPASGLSRADRMAFALRQLKVDTCDDIPLGLQATLTMSWFNYLPFSKDFAYKDVDGNPVDAYNSADFIAYINAWKKENLDEVPNPFWNAASAETAGFLASKYGYPEMRDWRDADGRAKFHWREYTALPRGVTAPSGTNYNTANPGGAPKTNTRIDRNAGKAAVKQKIVAHAQQLGVDPGVALGICYCESRFNPGTAPSSAGAVGLMQVLPSSAPGVDLHDPDQNIQAGLRLYKSYLRQLGSPREALWAYNWGPAYFKAFLAGKRSSVPLSVQEYANNVLFYATGVIPAPSAPVPQSPAAETSPMKLGTASLPADVLSQTQDAMDQDWKPDYYTDRASFLYKDHSFALGETSRIDGSDSFQPMNVWPEKVSIVFVNTLAAMPLAGQQYATYQHLGPAGTMVVIGMTSVGLPGGESDPIHPGLAMVEGMASAMESQYQRLRGEWKAVSAVHRMQAVFVENQVLNMFGIRSALVSGWNTETSVDSPENVHAALTLTQYENVFEQLEPYKVLGTEQTYQQVLNTNLDPDKIDSIITQQKDAASQKQLRSIFQPIKDLALAKKNRDLSPVWKMLDDAAKGKYSCRDVGMKSPLSQQDVASLKKLMDSPVDQSTPATRAMAALTSTPLGLGYGSPGALLNVFAASSWAGLYPKVGESISSGSPSLNDYVLLVGDSRIPVSSQQKDVVFAPESGIDQLYNQLLDYQTRTNVPMHQAMSDFMASPAIQKQLAAVTQKDGPGVDMINNGHGAYKDLGLYAYPDPQHPGQWIQPLPILGTDFHPGFYFVDYRKNEAAALSNQADVAVSAALNAFQYGQKQTQTKGPAVPISTASGKTIDPGMLKGSAAAILNKTVIPFHSMSRAFPTFKLFLAEEDNTGAFRLYDDFYSYGSVLSIDVLRYRDKPDTAVIELTNFANLLNHRAFDGSSAGKREYEKSNMQPVPTSSEGPVEGGPAGKLRAGKRPTGLRMPDTILDLTEGFPQAQNGQKMNVPLQYYPLQTGAKIQVRMGFSNNPDALFPVFTGKVTQIEGEEVLQIVAQGFMLELLDSTPDLPTNSFLSLDTVIKPVENLIRNVANAFNTNYQRLPWFGRGAAYGGWGLFTDSGYTDTIMADILKCSNAKHFGHWQVNYQFGRDYIKGWSWTERTGDVLKDAGVSGLGTLLQSGIDRRSENIQIKAQWNVDGSLDIKNIDINKITRPTQRESPWLLLPAKYSIPDLPDNTPWKIIKDVSRRYPEQILKIAPYGYPVGCDATLVFACPNDVYVSRRAMANELELGRMTTDDGSQFDAWWSKRGWKMFQQFALTYGPATESVHGMIFGRRDVLPKEMMALTGYINSRGAGGYEQVFKAYQTMLKGSIVTGERGNTGGGNNATARSMQSAMDKDRINWFQLYQPRTDSLPTDPRPSDRVQPVRRWHIVDQNVIIHNGIRLNDQIYNAVRVDQNVMTASGMIDPQNWRMLDCDPAIIDPVANTQAGNSDLWKAYANSFLREEVGKMYDGELVIIGAPEIEPWDVVVLQDPYTGIAGPLEVDRVQHRFDQELGYITIIKPRLLISVNETVTAGLTAALSSFITNVLNGEHLTGGSAVAAGAIAASAGMGATFAGGVAAGMLGLGVAAPVGIAVGALAAVTVLYLADREQNANPIYIAPLNRFGLPWVGGLDGFQVANLATCIENEFHNLWQVDIQPTIDGFKDVHGLIDNLPTQ